VFAIQDEIATKVVKQIGSELTIEDTTQGVVRSRGTSSRDAYELYLRATHLAKSDDPLQLERAARLFEQSIALDREHVDSWIGLGDTYASAVYSLRYHRFLDETQPIALNAFRTALELDPTNTRAMGMLGLLLMLQEFRWKEGAALMKESVALNPYDAEIQATYGSFLLYMGQQEAASTIERAYRLSPFEPRVVYLRMLQLLRSGRSFEAVALAATHLLEEPGYSANVRAALVFASVSPVLAEKHLTRAREIAGADYPVHKSIEAIIAHGRKDTVRLEALRAELFELAHQTPVPILLGIPWREDQLIELWDISIKHMRAELAMNIFRLKPRNMPEEDWTRIKTLTRRDEADIGPGAPAWHERTRDEKAALLAAAKPLSEEEWDRYVGFYRSDPGQTVPNQTARLERKGDELIAHYPVTGLTRRLIPVGNHIFERLDFKQTFTFTLVNGQVTQLTRKWKSLITLNDTQVVYDKIE
jgi:tetratricopeptide (TPR) repeat protein